MTHYSDEAASTRMDFFKPSGKWYMTEAIDMAGHYLDPDMFKAIEDSLDEARPDRPGWWRSYNVVILDPYHENGYPVMFTAEVHE